MLDPLEVARVEVWPRQDLDAQAMSTRRQWLDRAEFTVYTRLLGQARVSRLLNEKAPAPALPIELPESYAGEIVSARSWPVLGIPMNE